MSGDYYTVRHALNLGDKQYVSSVGMYRAIAKVDIVDAGDDVTDNYLCVNGDKTSKFIRIEDQTTYIWKRFVEFVGFKP